MLDLQQNDPKELQCPYQRYWVDEANGKIFCLVDAPSADVAAAVHREAHGLVAQEMYQVVEGD